MLLSDTEIFNRCVSPAHFGLNSPMIEPFDEKSIRLTEHGQQIPSRGLSSYGYDISLGNFFRTLADRTKPLFLYGNVDNELTYINTEIGNGVDDHFVLKAKSFALGVSREKITMPRNTSAICMAKSTLARANFEVTVTPIEAGWTGYVTIEMFNKNNFDLCLKAGMGIMQLMLILGHEECNTSYADRNGGKGGKYQNQPCVPVAHC